MADEEVKHSRSLTCFLKLSRMLYKYNILDELTNVSKSLYNTTIFYGNVYFKFKFKIFNDFMSFIKSQKIKRKDPNIKSHFKNFIVNKFQNYIDIYLKIIETRKINNQILFNDLTDFFEICNELDLCDYNNFIDIFDLVYDDLLDGNICNNLIIDNDTNEDCIYKILSKIMMRVFRFQYKNRLNKNKLDMLNLVKIDIEISQKINDLETILCDFVQNDKFNEALDIQKQIKKMSVGITKNFKEMNKVAKEYKKLVKDSLT